MWGRKAINKDETMNTYIKSGPDRAVKNMKDVMTAMKYLQDSTINTRLINEKERVAARLKELDEDRMPNFQRKSSDDNWARWTSIGLEGKWNTFIKTQAATARSKAITYMDDNLKSLNEGYVTKYNKEQAEKDTEAGRALKTLIEKIEKLDTEWRRYKPISWQNPF